MVKSVYINKQLVKNDSDKLLLISGPCLLENEKLVRKVATNLLKYTKKNNFNFVFKCSFDKANRSSHKTIRNKITIDNVLETLNF